jgi:hypothetical protein
MALRVWPILGATMEGLPTTPVAYEGRKKVGSKIDYNQCEFPDHDGWVPHAMSVPPTREHT